MTFITENWIAIGAAVALVIPAIRAIVALTPSEADDRFIERIIPAIKGIFGIK